MTTQRISTNSSVLLEVVDLVAAYGSHIVLRDIYCHFIENTITAIVGPSGCGKSTFVKTLNRTLELIPGAEVLSGEVYLRGVGIYSGKTDAMAIRKRIGIIHQNPLPFPMSTVENVLFGARFHRHLDGMSPREYLKKVKDKQSGIRLMGFGHRVYKTIDPRSIHIMKMVMVMVWVLGLSKISAMQMYPMAGY